MANIVWNVEVYTVDDDGDQLDFMDGSLDRGFTSEQDAYEYKGMLSREYAGYGLCFYIEEGINNG